MNGGAAEQSQRTALVQEALTFGQLALAAGERTEASRWLERAHRIAPNDGTIRLLWASALIGTDNAKAASLFAGVLNSADVRDAWAGLASARLLSGDLSGAEAAAGKLLSRHVWRSDLSGLLDRLSRETGAPGWCALNGDGVVVAHSARAARIDALVDGKLLSPVLAAGIGAATDQIDNVTKFSLPSNWSRARRVLVMSGERHLIGSPIAPAAIARVEGYVEMGHDGLHGWAWRPADPDADPSISVHAGRSRKQIVATAPALGLSGLVPLARPRMFFLPCSELPSRVTLLRVLGSDGRDLTGSPIVRVGPDALGVAQARHGVARSAPHLTRKMSLRRGESKRRDPAIIILSADGCALPASQFEAIAATVDASVRILLLRQGHTRDQRSRFSRVTEIRGGIEAAMSSCPDNDLILLDGAAIVPPNWLRRLSDAAYGAPDIGTVTPFSNRGVAGYPTTMGCDLAWFSDRGGFQDLKTDHTTQDQHERTAHWLDQLSSRANGRSSVSVATGGGPCLLIRGDCLAEVGQFRPRFFAGGHGAAEDFCARANAAGWRNIVLPGLFVGLRECSPDEGDAIGWGSKAARRQLNERNTELLERLHPGYCNELKRSAARLAGPRRRLDIVRWRLDSREATILVTHDDGGGVERRIEAAVAEKKALGRRTILLRPGTSSNGKSEASVDGIEFPNLRFAIPAEQTALLRFLRAARVADTEIHHFLNHHPLTIETVLTLGMPFDCHIHDYVWFCPRVALVGHENRYCGEPDIAACESCVAKLGSYLREVIRPGALVVRSRDILSGARRVIAPSRDAALRIARHFRGISPQIIPHEDDDAVAEPLPAPVADDKIRVCVAGAIGVHKGFDVLLACAQDAAKHQLDLSFVVAGTTIDDRRLMDTGKVWVTGPYQPGDAVALIRSQRAVVGFLPSIWPETWCLTLTELWRAGLRVAAFDIGAPAERIRRTGRGFLLSTGLSPGAINEALLQSAGRLSFASDPASFGLKALR